MDEKAGRFTAAPHLEGPCASGCARAFFRAQLPFLYASWRRRTRYVLQGLRSAP